MSKPRKRRVQLELHPHEDEKLAKLKEATKCTVERDIFVKGLNALEFLTAHNGSKIWIEEPGKPMREIAVLNL